MILLGWQPFFFSLELLYIWLSLKQNVVKKQNKKDSMPGNDFCVVTFISTNLEF